MITIADLKEKYASPREAIIALLTAAARRARMQGRGDIARRADAIRAREFPGNKAEDAETAHDPKTGQFTASEISSAISEHKKQNLKGHYGLRVDEEPIIGEKVRPSRQWRNGEPTNRTLSGTSAIRIKDHTPEGVLKHLEAMRLAGQSNRGAYYPGKHVYLIHSQELPLRGADLNEGVFKNANLIGRWKKGGYGLAPILPNNEHKAKDASVDPQGRATVGHQRDPNGGFGWAIGGRVGTGKGQMRMSRAVRSGRGLANTGTESVGGDAEFEEGKHPRGEGGKFSSTPTNEHHYIKQTAMGAIPAKDPATEWDVHHGSNKIGTIKKVGTYVSGGVVHSARGGAKTGASKMVYAYHGHHEPSDTRTKAHPTHAAALKELTQLHGAHLAKGSSNDMALDAALAQDKRTYDQDGRLHVDQANISKAAVNPYLGKEINAVMKDEPGWKMLEAEKRYNLLRHPDELKKAAATFNGLPILWQHRPASAEAHPHEITIGATGNDASFEHPYLRNSLSIWPAYATEAIEDGGQKQLSCGYAYKADMTPGTYEGEPYDGVMRDIVGNHVALVREGRAGADCAVGDASIEEQQWCAIERALRRLTA